MSSSSDKDKDKQVAKPTETELPLEELAKTRGTLPERYDLDKNPIKFRQWDGSLSEQAHDKDYMELVLRSGKHSDLVQKLLRLKIEKRAQEFPRWPANNAGGVRVLWIESRYWYERERLAPHFDDDWRKYRSMYLHSLELDPGEPMRNADYERYMINPIKRFYQKPGDWLEEKIIPMFTNDKYRAHGIRKCITWPLMGLGLLSIAYYRFRYTERNWEIRNGTNYMVGKRKVYPGDPAWGKPDPRTSPWHFSDNGFLTRTIYEDLRDYEDCTVTI